MRSRLWNFFISVEILSNIEWNIFVLIQTYVEDIFFIRDSVLNGYFCLLNLTTLKVGPMAYPLPTALLPSPHNEH